MRLLVKTVLFLLILAFARISAAADPPLESVIDKDDIRNIKILSQRPDRVNFYLTHADKTKYRIPNLSPADAASLLERIKSRKKLVLETRQNERGYRDVLTWREAP